MDPSPAATTKAATNSGDMDPEHARRVQAFLAGLGASDPNLPGPAHQSKDFYSDLIRSLLEVDSISPGKVSCSFVVVPAIPNGYKGLNGGVVAVVAERVAVACARTVVTEGKQLVIGEIRMSYLSAAPMNAELLVEGSVLKSGRNLTVVFTEFRIKKSKKLLYTSQAFVFHNSTTSKL